MADALRSGRSVRKGMGVQISPWAQTNMNSKIDRKDSTIILTITIPVSLISKTKEEVIDEHVKEAAIAGFRKVCGPWEVL